MAESIIKQTNRTLLIEEINPEKLNLLTLVGDVRGLDSLSDDKIKEINEALLVRNFEEFLEKFDPTVYSFFNAATGKIVYSKEKPAGVPENMLSIVHLNAHNDFLKMLMTLVETKRSQGIINADFKFEKLTEMISPSKVMDDIKQVRKELQYTYTEYAKLEDGDPHKLDLGDKLNSMFEEASANYQNLMAMIPLAISDIKTRLLLGESKESESNDALTLGLLTMSSEGELTVIEAPKVEEDVIASLASATIETLQKHTNEVLQIAKDNSFDGISIEFTDEVDIPFSSETFSKLLASVIAAKGNLLLLVENPYSSTDAAVAKPLSSANWIVYHKKNNELLKSFTEQAANFPNNRYLPSTDFTEETLADGFSDSKRFSPDGKNGRYSRLDDILYWTASNRGGIALYHIEKDYYNLSGKSTFKNLRALIHQLQQQK